MVFAFIQAKEFAMQLMPISTDTVNTETIFTDYTAQDNSMSNFSNELDSALSEADSGGERYAKRDKDDDSSHDDEEKNSPYSVKAEIYSFFAPQEPRFNQEELTKLAQAFQNDNVCMEAQNALADIMNSPTGPTLKDLLSVLSQSTKGGNAALDTNEIAYLQNLAGRANPNQPTVLYDSIRFQDSLSGMKNFLASIKQNPTTLSKEELSALGKALGLPEDMQKAMQQTLASFDKNKPLSNTQVDAIFKDAQALLETKTNDFAVMKKSLEQNLKPLYESAQKREAEERRALMLENKEVLYSKTLIEDTVITKVMGEDLNRSTVNGRKLEEKDSRNKSAQAQKPVQNNQDTETAQHSSVKQNAAAVPQNEAEPGIVTKQADSLSDTDVLAEAKQENSLIANIVRDERDAAAKAEDKFFAGKTEEKEQSREQAERFNPVEAVKNTQENKKEHSDTFSGSRNEERSAERMAGMEGAQNVQAGPVFENVQTANFSDTAENLRTQVQDTVLTMMKSGAKRLEVSLNPVELGQMAVVLTMKNGEINAVIQADKAESASLINQQLDTIRQELENQGFKVENIDVEVGLSNHSDSQTGQNWESMQQHNSEQAFRENLQNLNYLRALARKNSSSEDSLAHNMHNMGSITAGKENTSLQGLHIIA